MLSPCVQLFAQFGDLVGFGPGQVVLLAQVMLKIEQLDGVVFKVFQQLIVSSADRSTRALHPVIAVVGEVPE